MPFCAYASILVVVLLGFAYLTYRCWRRFFYDGIEFFAAGLVTMAVVVTAAILLLVGFSSRNEVEQYLAITTSTSSSVTNNQITTYVKSVTTSGNKLSATQCTAPLNQEDCASLRPGDRIVITRTCGDLGFCTSIVTAKEWPESVE